MSPGTAANITPSCRPIGGVESNVSSDTRGIMTRFLAVKTFQQLPRETEKSLSQVKGSRSKTRNLFRKPWSWKFCVLLALNFSLCNLCVLVQRSEKVMRCVRPNSVLIFCFWCNREREWVPRQWEMEICCLHLLQWNEFKDHGSFYEFILTQCAWFLQIILLGVSFERLDENTDFQWTWWMPHSAQGFLFTKRQSRFVA